MVQKLEVIESKLASVSLIYLIQTIFLSLILAANSEEEKEPIIDDEFCNQKLAEYKQKVPNIITAYQKFIKDYPDCS